MGTTGESPALRQLHESLWYGLLVGAGHEYRAVRERAAATALDAAGLATLADLDALALEHVREAGADEIWPALLEDDAAEPLAHWWWHLGAIRAGTYPELLLPEALRSLP